MKKNLLAVAVAAAVLAPIAAQAETTLYGFIDESVDAVHSWSTCTDTGCHPQRYTGTPTPVTSDATQGVGQSLKYSQVSDNSSYFGIKGVHHLGGDLDGLYQLESFVNIEGDNTHTTLGSRNNFIGLGSKTWGAIKLGKNDTPYKTSTASLDPFSVTVGDYNAIMGNTGGDQRAEFDYRAFHAIWYESPKFGAFNFNLMYAPSNQEGGNSWEVPLGNSISATCNGLNGPGTQGTADKAGGDGCIDGGFGSLLSADVNYHAGPLFLTGAYELHKKVDRSADFGATAGTDEANESAWKIGASYTFAKVNKLSAIYEHLHRGGPADDRNRKGYYLSDVQKLPYSTDLMLAWAHAGQSDLQPNGLTSGPGCDVFGNCSNVDNSSEGVTKDTANLYAIGLRHHFTKDTNAYIVYAMDKNNGAGHYSLGASGHGLTTTATNTAGETFKALSVGMQTHF